MKQSFVKWFCLVFLAAFPGSCFVYAQLAEQDSLGRQMAGVNEYLDSLDKAVDELILTTEPVVARRYHADITIHPEGYFDVREEYEIQFNQPRHGIYRNIPLRASLGDVPGNDLFPGTGAFGLEGSPDSNHSPDTNHTSDANGSSTVAKLRRYLRSVIFPSTNAREITVDEIEDRKSTRLNSSH